MFPPKKKKPGLDVVVAVGKPKGKPDLSDPDPLDEKPKKRVPFATEEAEETPEVEESEDYGAKLIADLEAAGEEHGLDANQSRAVAASMFSAMAKCLRGEQEPEHDMGGADLEGEEE